MANKNAVPPPNAKKWLPGESGNPAGRPKMPPELKAANKLTRVQFDTLLNEVLDMTTEQLNQLMSGPDTKQIAKMVGSIVQRAVENGCPVRMNFLLQKMLGKVEWADDRSLNVTPEDDKPKDSGPVYVVRLNQNGKFVSARPRLREATPQPPGESQAVTPEVLPPEDS